MAGGKQRRASDRNEKGNGQAEEMTSATIGQTSICSISNTRNEYALRARSYQVALRAPASGAAAISAPIPPSSSAARDQIRTGVSNDA